MDCSTPGFPVHHQLPEFTQTHVHWVCDAIQPSHPLSSPSPPAFNLSSIRIFSNESALHIRWPSTGVSALASEYSELISFRMDWLDLLSVQGILKNLLQHHSSKASVLWHSAFFMVRGGYREIHWMLFSTRKIVLVFDFEEPRNSKSRKLVWRWS